MSQSMIQYIGGSSGGSCGYCGNKKAIPKATYQNNEASSNQSRSDPIVDEGSSISFGAWGHRLTTSDYNQLLNLGWRRSGKYLYKPIMEITCCPQYTIRLDVKKFYLSRTQKRVLRAMNEYLKFDKKPKVPIKPMAKQDYPNRPNSFKTSRIKDQFPPVKKEKGDRPVEKKKIMRRRRAFERLAKKGVDIEEYKRCRIEKEESRRKTIESYLWPYVPEEWKHKLEIRLVKKGTSEFDESIDESYALYCKYQQNVHKDHEFSRKGYENFLVNTPLITQDDIPGVTALGSYHQQYLIDGRIIAVGVIDILPHCLSSKYFYYDPDYSFLTLGTYSALREIAFTQELEKSRPCLHYYYMGYYLFDCPKMRYKGRFRPSYLLCDHSYDWVPLDEAESMIVANDGKFTNFRPELSPPLRPGIQSIKCVVQNQATLYGRIRESLSDKEEWDEKMREYVRYTGPLSQRVLLFL